MILVDTSALLELVHGTGSEVNARLRELVTSSAPLAVTQAVSMEVLAGARNEADEGDLRRMLRWFVMLPVEPDVDFEAAARIYRLCRRTGVTLRSLIDCLVASVAMRNNASVLAQDADFGRMAGVVNLKLDPATARP